MFYKIGVYKNFAKFIGKHLPWSLCNLILKRDSSRGVFLWVLRSFSEYLFYRTHPNDCVWHFVATGCHRMPTIGCLLFFDNFPNKRLQLRLRFTLRLQFTFKHLRSQNERVLSQTFSTKPHKDFMHLLSRRSRIVITILFKNTLQRKSASMKVCLHAMEKL